MFEDSRRNFGVKYSPVANFHNFPVGKTEIGVLNQPPKAVRLFSRVFLSFPFPMK